MTQLTFEPPGEHLFIRSVDRDGIRIGTETHRESLIVTAERLLAPWSPSHFGELEEQHFDAVLAVEPEIVLLGTGARQSFLEPRLAMIFHRAGIGIEVMTTEAACRTFNVLVGEGRNVAAALLPPNA